MIVMKFGGTSLGDAEHIKTASKLVKDRAGQKPLVVASAIGSTIGPDGKKTTKVTDLLIKAARKAIAGDIISGFSEVEARHMGVLEGLGMDKGLVAPLLRELNELLNGIFLIKELTTRTMDYVMSFGERISAVILAEQLKLDGVNAASVDAFDLGFLTDSKYGSARPLDDTPERIRTAFAARSEDILVTTGFIAKNAAGEITTVGRQGSDYTAAYFGAALKVDEVQIWTDVDGVLTADPSIIKDAKPLAKMAFSEAGELSYYGAAVLHPSTMLPAVEEGIPLRVLNTFRPESPGTIILPDIEVDGVPVKSIVYKEDLTLINVVSSRMLGQVGFMAHLFEVFGRHNVAIEMIATSEISVSLTTDCTEGVEAAAEELRNSEVATVVVEPGKAIICAVGKGMKNCVGTSSRVFGAVAKAGVSVQMISGGASEINIAFLVNNDEVTKVVTSLHDEFFAKN